MSYSLLIFGPISLILLLSIFKYVRNMRMFRIAKNTLKEEAGDIVDRVERDVEGLKNEIGEYVSSDYFQNLSDDVKREVKKDLDYMKYEAMEDIEDGIEHAKRIFFETMHKLNLFSRSLLKKFINFSLHYLVIFLRVFRDFNDYIYIKARDFFLYNATKDKDSVNTFWHTLKEYKKEKDEENKE